MSSHYTGREELLRDLLGATTVEVLDDGVIVDGRFLPVLDDVILAIEPARLPASIRARIAEADGTGVATSATAFAPEIQHTFGEEWKAHGEVLSEHSDEFEQYFDIVDLDSLRDARVADLGCGSGRWATFVAPICREIVLVDFSDAIFVARDNLRSASNTVFVLADVLDLPFRSGAFDFAYCLGVLHHLPVDALDACRSLRRYGDRLLVYLYYNLDNRPAYFRTLLRPVTRARDVLARVRSNRARTLITWLLTVLIYVPLASAGRVARPLGLARFVPLADTYAGKSVRRLRQDAYDRFFTGIEQRFTRTQIAALTDTFEEVRVSDGLPYWHFLCQ